MCETPEIGDTRCWSYERVNKGLVLDYNKHTVFRNLVPIPIKEKATDGKDLVSNPRSGRRFCKKCMHDSIGDGVFCSLNCMGARTLDIGGMYLEAPPLEPQRLAANYLDRFGNLAS